MDSTATVTISRMERRDLDVALDWAAAEGWNPGLHDTECFFAADPHGFFMAKVDDRPIGAISAVAYDECFAFVGLYIVAPEFRGQGHGWRLWQTAMDYTGTRNVGLDGVVEQQANYRKSGFQIAYRNIRYEGVGGAVEIVDGAPDTDYVAMEEVPWPELIAYDRACFPAARESFLAQWICQPGVRTVAAIQYGSLAGYGVLRPCHNGYKCGPLFCENEHIAEGVFSRLSATTVGAPIFLDIPEPNARAAALVSRHDMVPQFETARMYTGGLPSVDLGKVYGVTSFELG